jgi:hypothetical protein
MDRQRSDWVGFLSNSSTKQMRLTQQYSQEQLVRPIQDVAEGE